MWWVATLRNEQIVSRRERWVDRTFWAAFLDGGSVLLGFVRFLVCLSSRLNIFIHGLGWRDWDVTMAWKMMGRFTIFLCDHVLLLASL